MDMKKYIYILLLFFPFIGFSQINVSGKVIDENGNSIAYANVIFSNSTVGTATDSEGKFSLYSEKKYSEIEVSFIGYNTKKVTLSGNNIQNLTVILVEGEELSEVVVVGKPKKALSKKENPAYPILQAIWKNKNKNGLQNASAYEYKKYSTVELGLNNLDTLFLQRMLRKEYDTIRKILSEKKYKETFSLPMYLKEKVEKVYGDNQLKKQRIDIEAERSQGIVQEGFGLERISRTFEEFDVYKNSYNILKKEFVGPLSEYGYGTYHYVLNDTISKEGRTFYRIFFFPKVDGDLALEGNFLVDSKSFIIKSMEVRTMPKTNINLVRSLFIEKHFTIVNDSIYYPEKEIQEGDFTFKSKNDEEKGLYVHNEIYYSDVKLNLLKTSDFYDKQTIKVRADQFFREDAYWDNNLINSKQLTKTKSLIQEVGNNSQVKVISAGVDILSTGYIPINDKLQFGNFWTTAASNDVEGNRFKIGMRTFTSTEDRFRSYFYGAYGTKDKEFKYGISGKYVLTHQPRIVLGAAYQNDNLQLGNLVMRDDVSLNFLNPSNFLFARGDNYYLTKSQKVHTVVSFQPHKNLQISLFGIYQQLAPADENHFSIAYKNPDTGEVLEKYKDLNTGISLSYTPNRGTYGYGVEQRFEDRLYSTYTLKYTRGTEGALNSRFNYDKLQLRIDKPFPIFGLGVLHTTLEAGKIFGVAPLTALSPTPANQAYSLTPHTFALLDYYDFITDTYVNGYFEHHFNGFIFNRIPYVSKARLRSLVFARFAYGTISDKNRNATISNVIFNSPEKLYWEYGFGIENIGVGNFRFIRVDFIWRNDFNDVNGVRNPKFGIRVGLVPMF